MKVAIIGATGHAGSLILAEALNRNLAVTAIVRHPEKLEVEVPILVKDLCKTLYLIFDYPYKYYTFKHFEV